jgi:hypothetical protein
LANIYCKWLRKQVKAKDYKLIADAYNTLEGSNFIRGLSPTLLVGSSSPFFDNETKKYFLQQLRVAPLYPVIFALPRIRIAYDLLDRNVKSSSLSSLIIYVSK